VIYVLGTTLLGMKGLIIVVIIFGIIPRRIVVMGTAIGGSNIQDAYPMQLYHHVGGWWVFYNIIQKGGVATVNVFSCM
jgi:hypothetical protein